jgi:hypothetical protein
MVGTDFFLSGKFLVVGYCRHAPGTCSCERRIRVEVYLHAEMNFYLSDEERQRKLEIKVAENSFVEQCDSYRDASCV